jgi:hypothetical protein
MPGVIGAQLDLYTRRHYRNPLWPHRPFRFLARR